MSKEKGACKQNQPSFNVFGYGSLLWKQGFEFSTKKTGYIEGFKRKFWQENCTHRGTEEKVLLIKTFMSFKTNMSFSGIMIFDMQILISTLFSSL